MTESIDVHKVFAEYFKGCETLAYALSSKLAEGNICVNIEEYKNWLQAKSEENDQGKRENDPLYEVTAADFEQQCQPGLYVTHSENELKPFVIRNNKAYLQRYFTYESSIIENIRRLGNNLKIITGGPGTGKTYSVATELQRLFSDNPGLKVALAAPTGKAAVRMKESIKNFSADSANKVPPEIKTKLTALKASTIHMLLGYVHDSVFFRYNEDRHLPHDIIIIDECSMVDGALMAKLLNAVGGKTILYLLGDKDQLASVEAGSVFGDICRSHGSTLLEGRVNIREKSWRFDKDLGIGKFSRDVITGNTATLNDFSGDEQVTIDPEYSEELFREYALKYIDYIVEPDTRKALQKMDNVRFLCATRESDHSVAETNQLIGKLLKKEINDISLFNPAPGFYHNQPVIVTRNDYTLGLFNGDTGLIRKEGDSLYAFFESADGEIRKIPAGYLNHFDTVFAMTIHKSQGSEFDSVAILLPEKQGEKLLTRELLYTGVTRARKKVLVQSSEEMIRKCIAREVTRGSGLQERLKSA